MTYKPLVYKGLWVIILFPCSANTIVFYATQKKLLYTSKILYLLRFFNFDDKTKNKIITKKHE